MINENLQSNTMTINEIRLKIKRQQEIKMNLLEKRKLIIFRMMDLMKIIDSKKEERLNTSDKEMYIVKKIHT